MLLRYQFDCLIANSNLYRYLDLFFMLVSFIKNSTVLASELFFTMLSLILFENLIQLYREYGFDTAQILEFVAARSTFFSLILLHHEW